MVICKFNSNTIISIIKDGSSYFKSCRNRLWGGPDFFPFSYTNVARIIKIDEASWNDFKVTWAIALARSAKDSNGQKNHCSAEEKKAEEETQVVLSYEVDDSLEIEGYSFSATANQINSMSKFL